MRSPLIFSAVLTLLATAATANDLVVHANIYDELEPSCASPAGYAASGCGGACGQGLCSSGCHGKKCGKFCKASCADTLSGNGCCNVCNMPQHLRYDAVDHGYYYFRPYNYRHIRWHQEAVTAWGGDPRNPYSNAIFDTIYAQSRADDLESVPVQMPVAPQPGATVLPSEPPVPMPMIDPQARRSTGLNSIRLTTGR